MSPAVPALRRMVVVVAFLAAGCASFSQARDQVLIREPGHRTYSPPVAVSESAKTLWEYAVLSENAYVGDWKKQRRDAPRQAAIVLRLPEATSETYSTQCVP